MIQNRENAEEIARKALNFIAHDQDLAEFFLTASGLRAEHLRAAAESSSFLAHVLDFITEADTRVLDFAAFANVTPQQVMAARTILAGPGSHGWDAS